MHPLLGKHLFIIIAHPDDEGYLFGGTVWKNNRLGGKATIMCATLGEKGTSHLTKRMTTAQLKKQRHGELLSAAKFVGGASVRVARLPDGQVSRYEKKYLAFVRRAVKIARPDVILSFGPDGLTGHRDHITCWRVSRQVSRETKIPFFVATVPPKYRAKAAGWYVAGRVNPHYHRIHPYRVATTKVPVKAGLKRAILKHYPSQMNPKKVYRTFPAQAARDFAAAEYFAAEH